MTAATTPKSKSTAAALSPARTKLCLALLVLLGFSLGCSEFVVIGIESDLATELGVSLATAGQLISVFALVYAIATPVLALSTGRFRRYQLLVYYSIVFVLGNLVMALAPNFQVLFISRIVLGSVSGALLAVGVTYIPELLSPQQTSLAISVVYGAFSVAMVFVTSIGKFVADTLDWHVAMYGTLTFAVLICGALVAFMPRAGQTDEPATFREQAVCYANRASSPACLSFCLAWARSMYSTATLRLILSRCWVWALFRRAPRLWPTACSA